MKNRKSFYIQLLIIFSLLVSCSNSANQVQKTSDIQTLKSDASKLDSELSWTIDLEPERLTKSVNDDINFLNDVQPNTQIISSIKNFKEKKYPELAEFGSLDDSDILPEIKKSLNVFFTAVSKNVDKEGISHFSSDYSMNYIFFIKDLAKGWNDKFNQTFPQIELVEKKEEKTKNKKNIEKSEKKEYEQLFLEWIFGEPEFSDDLILIPARIFCKPGSIDVIMYVSSSDSKILQININKWIKNDEKR